MMRLYSELADWFYLVSPTDEYVEEAELYARLLRETHAGAIRTLLELGSGGGCNAFHLKRDFTLTLADMSPRMTALSRALNPECEHVVGDMRDLRLGRTFDAVFVHDAVSYLTTLEDLRAAMRTAAAHLAPGGVALWAPDYVRETFSETTDHGGGDGERGRLRYVEWVRDPDPNDATYLVDYAFMIEEQGDVRVIHDRHVEGVFGRDDWIEALSETGFTARVVRDRWNRDLFLATRR
jgi:SAM-dependent methyltransferase